MPIQLANDKVSWDQFIDSSPYGTIFHKWDFLKIMERYSGYKSLPYVISKGNEPICLFPLFYKRRKGLKMIYSPPPQFLLYVPHLGFVMGNGYDTIKQERKEEFMDIVVSEMDREISRLSPNYVFISTIPKFVDMRSFQWRGYRAIPHYTYNINLDRPLDLIFESFNKSCKKSIKSYGNEQFVIKQVYDADLFFKVMNERLSEERGTFFKNTDTDYLKSILSAFPENVKMYFMYEGDRVVSVRVVCEYNRKVLFWMGAAAIKKGHYNEFMIWEMIKNAKGKSFKEIENWGAHTKRLCPFKTKFNPSVDIYYALTKEDAVGTFARLLHGNVSKILDKLPYSNVMSRLVKS